MTIETSQQGATSVVEIDGAIDSESCERLLAVVREVIAAGSRRITLDMSAVEAIGDQGLFALMQAMKLTRSHGGVINIAQPSDAVREALSLSDLDKLLRIFDSNEEALSIT